MNILKFGTVNSYFMHHFMEQMTGIVCIGRGILYPKFTEVDTIEKMAIVRSDVGVGPTASAIAILSTICFSERRVFSSLLSD